MPFEKRWTQVKLNLMPSANTTSSTAPTQKETVTFCLFSTYHLFSHRSFLLLHFQFHKRHFALVLLHFSFMKTFTAVLDPTNRGYLASFVLITLSICGVYYLGHALIADNFDVPITQISKVALKGTGADTVSAKCKNKCRPSGSEVWPEGIVAKTSDLDMRPMRDSTNKKAHSHHSKNLLAIAAGVKQKYLVDKIITKFLKSGFIVMVFHYDGIVDQWKDLGWASDVIHVSAMDQTKWWFAKRFLHPDIVSEYDYLFVWDEDLEVDHFDPGRYLTIVKEEGLDLSQPALDRGKSGIHHHITAHRKNSKVHRRYYKLKGGKRCYKNSTSPPCIGWVEMMVPVFSKAAWRCAWYLIQNDLIHGWGIDFQLGYCAQGDRKKKVGVVDAEYIVHLGLATLGGSNHKGSGDIHPGNDRVEVRKQSCNEMHIFRQRWNQAVKGDKCWIDRYRDTK